MRTTLVHLVRCGLGAVVIAGFFGHGSSSAATFAPGFAESTFSTGWNEPVGVIFGRNPDGSKQRMYVWERTGRVWIAEDGVRLAAPLLDISDEVAGYRDHGMLGFALDPNFATNGRFYVMYVVDRHHLLNFGTPAYNPATNDYFKPTIGRITRYTARASDDRRTADPASRLVLVGETKSTGFAVLHESHSVGSLFFGRDGTLLATCGDGASYNAMDNGHQAGGAYGDAGVTDGIINAAQNIGAFRSQLPESLNGKLIRIDPATGNGVPGNPLYQSGSPRSARSRMWARGLRNPCRFTLRPGTGSTVPADANPGTFFIGDVGWNSKEDLHVADVGGRNFGWPLFEGMDQQPAYWAARPAGMNGTDHTRPLADWRTGSTARVNVGGTIYNMGAAGNPVSGSSFGGNCSIGGCWYQGTDFPADYAGTYFHADYGDGWIRNFRISANNQIEAIRTFASNTGGVMFVTTHPETGGIYYIPFGGQIMKVEYVGGTPPVAKAGAHRTWGMSPLTVNFSSLGSTDPEGGALRFLWDFGDGVTSTLPNPSHTYTAAGRIVYNAELTVTDSRGFERSATIPIHVNNTPPRVRITSPGNLTRYPLDRGNITYNLTAEVSDAESSNPSLDYAWVTSLHHNEHHHDDPPDTNPSTTTVITPIGPGSDPDEHGDNAVYYYAIRLTVTDEQGLSSTDEVILLPQTGTLPVATVADAIIVPRGGGEWVKVLANDLGAVTEANFASIQIITPPAHGSAVVDPLTGWIRYLNNGDAAGTDSFSYRVTTFGGIPSPVATVSISVAVPPAGTSTATIIASNADAEEPPIGELNTTSTDLDLGFGDDNTQWIVGMRFSALAVPQGAKIISANIQFTTDNSPASMTPLSLLIQGEASDSAALFDDAFARPSFRPRTNSSVTWAPPAWTTAGQRGASQLTTSLAPIVQEIVNRDGWVGGNNLVMFITGTGHVEGESYDGAVAVGDLSVAPQLTVSFNGTNHRPLARADSASVAGGQTVVINVAANDFDPENALAPGSVQIVSPPERGWLAVNPANSQITYTHDGAPNTKDAFTYSIADATGARSAPAPVFLDVTPAPIEVTEWASYNDQTAGASTHPNATTWDVFGPAAGPLRNGATGVNLPAAITITNSGAEPAGTMSAPNAGTPAATIFSPFVSWADDGDQAILIEAGDTVAYTFTGLDPTRRYTFRGTSVRGNNYADRWTRAEIQGADSQINAHTGSVLTSAQQPAFLSATQAAWNAGENRATGDVVGWDDIIPGADGSFTVVLTEYAGDYPGGNASGAPYSYGFQAFRLEQVQVGPAEPPTTTPDFVEMHYQQKVLLDVLANDTGFIDASTVTIVSPPASGTVNVNAQGRVLYTHVTGAPVSDSFTYRVGGPGGTSQAATVTINFATTLRIANSQLNVPSNPPPTAFQLIPAFPTNPTFDQPLALANPPGDTQRLFICEKTGLLRAIADVTAPNPVAVTVLDLPTLLESRGETLLSGGEQGLLSVAFHPSYDSNRYFYVFYSVNAFRPGTTTLANFERVSRFTMQVGNPLAADTASELVLIQQEDQADNHQGGSLNFGPDGYLYISLGDEGGGDDSFDNSQKINGDFFSGILRIDVDKKPGSLNPNNHAAVLRDGGVARYAVPPDNPWIGATSFNGLAVTPSTVRTEFWAVGLRNPWRTSFDPATGELWCADVGQGLYEEVNILTRGANYGWAYREGFHDGPKAPVAGFAGTDPIYEYNHTGLPGDPNFEGNCVTGGVVYRGSRFSGLVGAYIFGDYVSGNIWSLRRNVGGPPTVTRLAGQGGIAGFGIDPSNGDVLLCDLDNNVLRRLIVNEAPGSTFPQLLSETRLFSDLMDLAPAPGLLPYAVNLSFWSDHAIKRRWFIVPDGAGDFTYSRDGEWALPDGAIWVKHFDLDLTRGNPATRRRIETRLLVKNSAGVYGVSYRWNDAQTDATLVPDQGADIPLNIIENGNARVQNWRIPSRADCMTCHTPQAGYALSFNTRQLNLPSIINGFTGNQISLLEDYGFLTNSAGSPHLLPRHVRPDETNFSVEGRVRSYFAVNCAYCHRPGGTAVPAAWDGRAHVTLAQTGLINGPTINNQGNPLNKLVVPGDTAHSVVLNRMALTNGFTRMPPLATNELDSVNIALITDWIANALPARQTYDQWRQQHFGNNTSPEGAPNADADGDGYSNETEFLTGTNPIRGDRFLQLDPIRDGGNLVLQFDLPPDRSFRIESTADFILWQPLDLPGNNGLPYAAGPIQITVPIQGAKRFYRATLWEN